MKAVINLSTEEVINFQLTQHGGLGKRLLDLLLIRQEQLEFGSRDRNNQQNCRTQN